jgi:hypothetical protein
MRFLFLCFSSIDFDLNKLKFNGPKNPLKISQWARDATLEPSYFQGAWVRAS